MEDSSKKEILEAIAQNANGLRAEMDTRFSEVLDAMSTFSTQVDKRFDAVDKRFDRIDKRLEHLENTTVTKDYMEGRLAAMSR